MGVRENHCGGYLSCPSWNRDRRCTMLQARIDRAERRGGTTRFHSCDRLRSSRDGYASISTLRIIGRRWILYVTRINLARSSASAYNLAIVSEVETNFKRKILYSYRSSYQRKHPVEQLISIHSWQNISKEKESSKIRIIFTGEKIDQSKVLTQAHFIPRWTNRAQPRPVYRENWWFHRLPKLTSDVTRGHQSEDETGGAMVARKEAGRRP